MDSTIKWTVSKTNINISQNIVSHTWKTSVPKFVENMTKNYIENSAKYGWNMLSKSSQRVDSVGGGLGTGDGRSDSVDRKMWWGDRHDPAELGPNPAATGRRSKKTVGDGDDGTNGHHKGSSSRTEVTTVPSAARIRVTNSGDRRWKNAAPGDGAGDCGDRRQYQSIPGSEGNLSKVSEQPGKLASNRHWPRKISSGTVDDDRKQVENGERSGTKQLLSDGCYGRTIW